MLKIILDTDLGSDCDDAGALALLHHLADMGRAEILAVTHCASAISGAVTVKMINEWYGRGEIPIGRYDKSIFLESETCIKYTKPLMDEYLKTRPMPEFENATRVLRRTLAENRDVTLAVIGMVNNIAELLRSEADDISPLCGAELVEQSVNEIYVMGGDFGDLDHGEWNIINDIGNAVYVSENCPVPIVYCGFEIGEKIMTGINLEKEEANPVRFAYRVVADKAKKEDITRNSWDPITVYCAVLKDTPLYKRSEKMKISFDSEGKVLLSEGDKDCYMIANATDDEVRAAIDELLY